jgi:hypothetical protein
MKGKGPNFFKKGYLIDAIKEMGGKWILNKYN